jgi:hypothetical protein
MPIFNPRTTGLALQEFQDFEKMLCKGSKGSGQSPSLKSDMAYRSNPRAPPHPYREKCAITGFTTHLPVSSGVICSFNGQHCVPKAAQRGGFPQGACHDRDQIVGFAAILYSFHPGQRGAETQLNDFHRNGAPRLKTLRKRRHWKLMHHLLEEVLLLHDPTLNCLR